jgi:hypothetical protein
MRPQDEMEREHEMRNKAVQCMAENTNKTDDIELKKKGSK